MPILMLVTVSHMTNVNVSFFIQYDTRPLVYSIDNEVSYRISSYFINSIIRRRIIIFVSTAITPLESKAKMRSVLTPEITTRMPGNLFASIISNPPKNTVIR